MALHFLWNAFPILLFRLPNSLGNWIVSALILFGSIRYGLLVVMGRRRLDSWDLAALALFGLCLAVSLISNTFIFEYPLAEWVTSLWVIVPLLYPFLLKSCNIEAEDVIQAIVFTGIIVGILIMFDQLVHLPFMELYTRAATTDTSLRRVVLMKNEMSFALVVLLARVMTATSLNRAAAYGLFLIPVSYSLFIVSESRLAIAATLVGIILFILLILKQIRRVISIVAVAAFVSLVVPIGLQKYIDQIYGTSDLLTQDTSTKYRIKELEYYLSYFYQTNGLGFGIMSTGVERHNFVARATQFGGTLLGAGNDWGIYIADLGILGALVQFGWVGLAAVIVTTLRVAFVLIQCARRAVNQTAIELGAIGTNVIGFSLSPLPMNFFTLDWTVLIGGTLLFFASCAGCFPRNRQSTKFAPRRAIGTQKFSKQ